MAQIRKQHIDIDLACVIASIIVHADEMLGPDGRGVDLDTLKLHLCDPRVKAWIRSLGALAPWPRVTTYSQTQEEG